MRSPDKHRFLNAIRHVESEEIPFQEDEIEVTVAERILGRPLPRVRPHELPADDYVELNRRCGNDMLFVNQVWELGRKNHFDAEGRKHYVDGTMKTRADLRTIAIPDLAAMTRRLEALLAAAEGTGLGVIYTPNQAPFIVTTAVGYQDYYMDLLLDPAFIHEFQDRVEEYCLRELEMALSYPIDVVQVGAVISATSGPMISRCLIEEFEFPSLRRRIALVKAKGLPVSLHFDGNALPLLDDFVAMGIDVLNPIEPCDGAQDIGWIKERYGAQLALHGNIDLAGILAFGTPEEVARDVVAHIERLAPGGGYIVASSHNITEAVPLENFYAMRDATLAYRHTPAAGRKADEPATG